MSGTFYGVGIGPGDPELITIKVKKIIEQAEVIAIPVKNKGEKSTAFEIVKQIIDMSGKTIIETVFEMTADPKKWDICAQTAADQITPFLRQGNNVVLITLGDISIYSTAMYVKKYINQAGFESVYLPGISSFSACASAGQISLAEGSEAFCVIPIGKHPEHYRVLLDHSDNFVLMKAGSAISWIENYLEEHDIKKEHAIVFSALGMNDEYIGMLDSSRKYSYFTTVIIKKKGWK